MRRFNESTARDAVVPELWIDSIRVTDRILAQHAETGHISRENAAELQRSVEEAEQQGNPVPEPIADLARTLNWMEMGLRDAVDLTTPRPAEAPASTAGSDMVVRPEGAAVGRGPAEVSANGVPVRMGENILEGGAHSRGVREVLSSQTPEAITKRYKVLENSEEMNRMVRTDAGRRTLQGLAREVLGLSETTTFEEVQQNYREINRRAHPDLWRNTNQYPTAEAYNMVMNGLYNFLSRGGNFDRLFPSVEAANGQIAA